MFIKPMLASPMPEDFDPANGHWVAEEKYDGHRLYVEVHGQDVKAWSRNELPRLLPPHVRQDLAKLPDGAYDGELISTEKTKSYGVTDLEQSDKLCFVMFDVLAIGADHRDTKTLPYSQRRILIEQIFRSILSMTGVTYSASQPLVSYNDITSIAKRVWKLGGEGLIIKDTRAAYFPGKRSKSWFKVKQCHTAVLKLIGFAPGRLGPHSTVLLEDSEGFQTTVKTLNTAEREAFDKKPNSFLGRKLRIEYQERTPDGSYRHPMWDRWENS